MKRCPFCAEEIQDQAIKCKHCGEFLDKTAERHPREKWYFKKSVLIMLFLCVGPFMLPLLWLHPRHSRKAKFFWTLMILVLTYLTTLLLKRSFQAIGDYYQELQSVVNGGF